MLSFVWLRWICNPPALSIGIYNALLGFKIFILNNIGIANPDERQEPCAPIHDQLYGNYMFLVVAKKSNV